nr:DNA polymerase II large subunit [Candidatus Undinarchaeales archaeon ERR594346 U_76725]
MNLSEYKNKIKEQTQKEFDIASKARNSALDFSNEPEIYIATNVEEKVEGLLQLKGLAKLIREIRKNTEVEEEVAFKLIEELVKLEPDRETAADNAIRASLAYLTQGAVAAPLEGIAKVTIGRNPDNTEYLSVYYAGPIRAAGGTAEAISVVMSDYTRKCLGLSKFKPTQDEVRRYIEEINWYHRRVHLQYKPSENEIETIIRNVPICLNGEPTEKVEVSNYRDLPRVETNRLRGGMCLVLAEGIAQKAPKLHKRLKHLEEKFGLDWSWIDGLLAIKKAKSEHLKVEIPKHEWISDITNEGAASLGKIIHKAVDEGEVWAKQLLEEEKEAPQHAKYLNEVPAGRPVFAFPSTRGGFTLRYGRTRATGYAALALNPALMYILNEFIAIGTQIRLEFPGKAAIVTPCDTINGPTVLLDSGEVIQVDTVEKALELRDEVVKIIQLGDILISAGDFVENNHPLPPSSYCEEWWSKQIFEKNPEEDSDALKRPYPLPNFEEALKFSEKYEIPLHPKYTFLWRHISKKGLEHLSNALEKAPTSGDITLKNTREIKKIFEELCIFHKISGENIIITKHSDALRHQLPIGLETTEAIRNSSHKSSLKIINELCKTKIMDRIPTTIGARMGRPEKAKPRKMVPAIHALFPTGGRKGRIRDLRKTVEKTPSVLIDVAKFYCRACNRSEMYPKCSVCDSSTELIATCPRCKRATKKEKCPICKIPPRAHEKKQVNIKSIFEKASQKLGNPELPPLKGVLGMGSRNKIPEPLEKGMLRALHNVYPFKDGTIRFDSTNAPLTHFRAKEVGISLEKLKALGYQKDRFGKEVNSTSQEIELLPQDIILSNHGDNPAGEYLLNISKFVDDLLVKYYGLQPYYNAKTGDDMIGSHVIALAPHTSTGIIGRVIGFTKARVGYAHPCFHDAKRRDCDGDEDAIMLLLDAFLNFSRELLPDRRGGRMDAPLVVTNELNPLEIDDEVYDLDIVEEYSLKFYESTIWTAEPSSVDMKRVRDVVNDENPFIGWGFTHDTSDIGLGAHFNVYSSGQMVEKLAKQMDLAERISAVNENIVAEKIIQSHFLPDIKGNLRKFSKQKVRCTKCNTKYRRPPLSGSCANCDGNLTLTVHRGSIEKYLGISQDLIKKYNLSTYLEQEINAFDKNILALFGAKEQKSLKKFTSSLST